MNDNLSQMLAIVASTMFFGTIWGLILLVVESHITYVPYQKLKCKMGKHTYTSGNFLKNNHYFCQAKNCKTPREHPKLEAIEGGKVEANHFRF